MNRVKIFEDREKKNKSLKEKEDYRQIHYAQNRANMRERMMKLKKFLKDKNDFSKTDEEFFEKYKHFFAEYGIKNYQELLKLINNYDKENPEELEKELVQKYKNSLKIDKQLSKDGKNGFSILPQIEKFKNLEISVINNENKGYFNGCKRFKKKLEKYNKINEFNFIPDMEKYIKEKIKSYEINNQSENICYIKNKKLKYNQETELIISSNNINITIERSNNNILSKGEDYTENGIPINELIDSKIKKILGRLSENDKLNYEKVEQIVNDISNNKNKELNNDLLKNNFCLDCHQSFKNDNNEECSLHKEHNFLCIPNNLASDINEELNININELDYNDSLNKIYIYLKKEQNKVLNYRKKIIIIFYADLLFHLYEIIVNNNSIEDLNESIIKINELYKTNIESKEEREINLYFKNYFLFFVQRITKLSYYKLKKIEKLMADLQDINNINKDVETDIFDDNSDAETQNYFFNSFKVKMNENDKCFDNDEININNTNKQLENEENKKYFLRLGLDLKFKYGKTESISELYNKAEENQIQPKFYEEFIRNELKIFDKKSK